MSINFWGANSANIYTANNHTQSNASATGMVMVGGVATYNNYNVGQALPIKTALNIFSLVAYGGMNITGGTNYSQNSGLQTGAVLTNYTMANLNGVIGQPIPYTYGLYQFPYLTSYLRCSSIGWASLNSNGTQSVTGGVLTLMAPDLALNTFLINSANVAGSGNNISTITSVNIVAPLGSTIIISIDGNTVSLNSFTTKYNGVAITNIQAQQILWNFPEATTLQINSNIYGSLLAPFASTSTGAYTIYGTLLTNNLTGSINAVQNLFIGNLPDLYNPSTTGTCTSFTTSSSTTSSSTTSSSTTSSSTTSSSTTTSTTSSSTTMSTTTCAPTPYDQTITDLIESVALQQAALAHILNAEGEKIQKAVALEITSDELITVNKSVEKMANTISQLEIILQDKIKTVSCNMCFRK